VCTQFGHQLLQRFKAIAFPSSEAALRSALLLQFQVKSLGIVQQTLNFPQEERMVQALQFLLDPVGRHGLGCWRDWFFFSRGKYDDIEWMLAERARGVGLRPVSNTY